jgi:hypothetical protein
LFGLVIGQEVWAWAAWCIPSLDGFKDHWYCPDPQRSTRFRWEQSPSCCLGESLKGAQYSGCYGGKLFAVSMCNKLVAIRYHNSSAVVHSITVVQWCTAEEVRHASRNADSACPFCIAVMAKRVTLSQHFVTHVVPPLGAQYYNSSAQN